MVHTPLKRLRIARNKTLQQVADAIGTDTGNLSRIEAGKQQSIELAPRLVDYFGRDAITETEILYPVRRLSKREARRMSLTTTPTPAARTARLQK